MPDLTYTTWVPDVIVAPDMQAARRVCHDYRVNPVSTLTQFLICDASSGASWRNGETFRLLDMMLHHRIDLFIVDWHRCDPEILHQVLLHDRYDIRSINYCWTRNPYHREPPPRPTANPFLDGVLR